MRALFLAMLALAVLGATPNGDPAADAKAMFANSERELRASIDRRPEGERKAWNDTIAVAERSTVRVIAAPFPSGMRGSIDLHASGFIIEGGKYLVGAGHSYHQIRSVFTGIGVKPPETVCFILPNGKRYSATVLYWHYDPKTPFGKEDIVIARIVNPDNDPLPSVDLAEKVVKDAQVIIAGYPLSIGKTREGKMTTRASGDLASLLCLGTIDAIDENTLRATLAAGVRLVHGNSGGPMFDLEGKIVGIATYSGKGWGGGTRVDAIRRRIDAITADDKKNEQSPVPSR